MTGESAKTRKDMPNVRGRIRYAPRPGSVPMTKETQERLIEVLEARYPGKARRAVDVCPVAVNHTIDNEADALETIRRCGESR